MNDCECKFTFKYYYDLSERSAWDVINNQYYKFCFIELKFFLKSFIKIY